MKEKVVSKKMLVPFILVTSLFFFWGLANNMTDTLLAAFKRIMDMSSLQTSFIQMAFYGAYFCFALPAALMIRKYSYKTGITVGLLLFAIGGFLFYPAGLTASYTFYLIAIYVLAGGCSVLETTANPFILSMGDESTAVRRLNLAQSFNPIGSISGLLISKFFILSALTEVSVRNLMTAEELAETQSKELFAVSMPYIVVGIAMILVLIVLLSYKMPPIKENDESKLKDTFKRLLKNKHYVFGVIAQFFYVGAQICVWSFLIQYVCVELNMEPDKAASYSVISLASFMVARFVFTWLMKFVKPALLLVLASIMTIICTVVVIFGSGMVAVIALVGISVFMSLMFPTIYGIALHGLGSDAKIGASGLIMAILGGALLTAVQGYVATNFAYIDTATNKLMDNYHLSYFVPLVCFVVVGIYGLFAYKTDKAKSAI